MGTDVHVIVTGEHAHARADAAVRRIDELEHRWSRFLPASEVSAINRHPGRPVEVSPDTVLLARAAVCAWRESAGFVDCTELAALVQSGYDRSFELLPDDRDPIVTSRRPNTLGLLGPADIVVDGTTVAIPPGSGFDPGGIGKGLAADLVVAELMADGADGACVDVGGDLRVAGSGPLGGGWTISVDHPSRPSPLAFVGLAGGAVATSTTLRRRWRVGGRLHHHLIDPRTGQSATSDIELVTVVADTGWRAEALAKAVLIRGGDDAFQLVDGTDAEALLVRVDGTVETSARWHRFTGSVNDDEPHTAEGIR